VFHLYVIRHPERDRLMLELSARNVGVGLHYPTPVHLNAAFAHLGRRAGAFPVSEAWAAECLSLPMCPELSDEQVGAVVERLSGSV
jgi:dTDP-4-amino-4,6-dideoxygalactose transaminase